MVIRSRTAPPRRLPEVQLLRYLPRTSVVHELWAGTKLLVVAALSVAVSVNPTWPAEALLAAVVLTAFTLARVPVGALPRVPRWLLGGLALGGVLALLAGGGTTVHVAGLSIGLHGLDQWAQFTVLVMLLILASLLIGLTTPLSELGPAFCRLLGPLRRLRVPIDEVVVAVALSVRALTLLVEELRVLNAARRTRRSRRRRGWGNAFSDAVDLLVTALVVSIRRAGELAQAIEARGGVAAMLPPGPHPGRRDAMALVLAAAAAVGIALI